MCLSTLYHIYLELVREHVPLCERSSLCVRSILTECQGATRAGGVVKHGWGFQIVQIDAYHIVWSERTR